MPRDARSAASHPPGPPAVDRLAKDAGSAFIVKRAFEAEQEGKDT